MRSLSTFCDIQLGYNARTRIESADDGDTPFLQMRDVSANGRVNSDSLERAHLANIGERYVANAGDIVFRSRGIPNIAAVVDAGQAQPVVVSPLVILRPNRKIVVPEYLVWYIGQAAAQRHFDEGAQGATMKMISKRSIETLPVPIPDLRTQSAIVELHALANEEGRLLTLLADKRRALVNSVLLDQARKTQPHGNGAGH